MDMSSLLNCGTCEKQYSANAPSCIHCGEPNPTKAAQQPAASEEPAPAEKRWYHAKGNIYGLFLLFFPAGIYYMWKGEHFPKWVRWTLTTLLGIVVLNSMSNADNTQSPQRNEMYSAINNYCTQAADGALNDTLDLLTTTGRLMPSDRDKLQGEFSDSFCGCYTEYFADAASEANTAEITHSFNSMANKKNKKFANREVATLIAGSIAFCERDTEKDIEAIFGAYLN